jgi:2-polyprenyl-3-methyl-5-hydroxy-6-metoxy-1,4-benzoquinol methylase
MCARVASCDDSTDMTGTIGYGYTEYQYPSPHGSCTHEYLFPAVLRVLKDEGIGAGDRILDLGCGNGSFAARLMASGFNVVGVDASESGIRQARQHHPNLTVHLGSVYDDLLTAIGAFRAIVSLEVVEHLYAPRTFARNVYSLLQPGGLAILSTPYHGYLKNLAIAVAGLSDRHFDPLWDGGHIKFWSEKTLRRLLDESGFKDIRFHHAGRLPLLAKSMIAVAHKSP